MKLTWKNKKKRPITAISTPSNLPFEAEQDDGTANQEPIVEDEDQTPHSSCSDLKRLAESFQAQGDSLAEDGKFREALGKWENALNLIPENAVLHEQKAQVLLEVGETWGALKAAARATDLDPSWAEAWITLGRAQLNFGEPDSAIESFDRALAIKPDSGEARDDRQTASHLVKRRKQLHSSGLNSTKNRYLVGDKLKDAEDS